MNSKIILVAVIVSLLVLNVRAHPIDENAIEEHIGKY